MKQADRDPKKWRAACYRNLTWEPGAFISSTDRNGLFCKFAAGMVSDFVACALLFVGREGVL